MRGPRCQRPMVSRGAPRYIRRMTRTRGSVLSKGGALGALCVVWAGCATPIEIPAADGGGMADYGVPTSTPDGGGGGWPDAGTSSDLFASPRDAFTGDSFRFDEASNGLLPSETEIDGLYGTVSALHADPAGAIFAVQTELLYWAPGEPDPQPLASAPGPVQQIATAGGASRIYFASDAGIHSVPRAGGATDLQAHHTPAAGSAFIGGVAVGTSWLFIVDTGAHQVLRIPLAGGATEVLYTSPNAAATLSPNPVALGDRAFFADDDGPFEVDAQGQVAPLGARRTSYRWADAVATADALLIAQVGDLNEALTRITLPAATEEVLIWIGGANNNAGLYGPLLFGDQLVWGASFGVYQTDVNTRATTLLVDEAARIAGDSSQGLLYWAPVAGQSVSRASLPAPP